MRYLALATDYDGTIAHHGKVDEPTLAGLERLRASGRKLVMVTGREIPDLQKTFDHFELFDWIVAENGALLYRPASRETELLAERPPEKFVQLLKERGVGPISVGGVIVATWEPYDPIVLQTIRDLGLELQVIFNKGAVMVLPANVNKATGLTAALERMALSPHNVVGVGDAENDHAFLSLCECSAAVANALPAVKQTADVALEIDHGAGVVQLIDRMIETDLRPVAHRLARRDLLLGKARDGVEERISAYGHGLLIAGPSGSGKSTVATGLIERMLQQKYQFVIVDPEGDYQGLEGAVSLGTNERAPSVEEAVQLLKVPRENVVINMVGMPISDRPAFFLSLLPRLLEQRAATGRPHWIIIDEAHHLLPTSWEPGSKSFPQRIENLMLITVHPREVSRQVLAFVDRVIAVGPGPAQTLEEFFAVCECGLPDLSGLKDKAEDEVVLWVREGEPSLRRIVPAPNQIERRRHIRKYAEGTLPPDRSFFFRGPDEKLNLRAQNLTLFLQLADGVDDDTWEYHLRRNDYSHWFRDCIKDSELAAEAEPLENDSLTPVESRRRIREVIERRYTLPSASPIPMPGTDAAPKFS